MTESQLQQQCYLWFRKQYPAEEGRLWMQYNNPRSMQSGRYLKLQGMVSGVSDLAFIRIDGTMVFIELKVPTGKQSPNQKWWQSVIQRCNSEYYIVKSLDEFQQLINQNIKTMSDSLQAKGKIVFIGETEVVSDKFKKREIVIDTGGEYPQQVKFEFTQDNVDRLSNYKIAETVAIHFNLRGREYNGKYYTNLQGWKIESDLVQAAKDPNQIGSGDLPF